jgi:hypothetical protein
VTFILCFHRRQVESYHLVFVAHIFSTGDSGDDVVSNTAQVLFVVSDARGFGGKSSSYHALDSSSGRA